MSIPSIASASSSQYSSFDQTAEIEHKSSLPFQPMAAFLNQRLTVVGKRHTQVAQFSLAEMLSHMNIKEVILKGSSVHQWRNKTPPADIDLQCHLEASNIQVDLADRLAEFLNTHSMNLCSSPPDLLRRSWFSQIAYTTKDAWSQLILCAGHLKPAASKIDLCYTSKTQAQYDTLGASQTIQINTDKKEATLIKKCSPALLDWMKKNNVLWFKPDIDNGLGRLSYRLNQCPDALLLQPQIAAIFCESASAETIQNIYLRVLREEYPHAQLSMDEKALLWVTVIETLMDPTTDTAPRGRLTDEIKNWSNFNDLERLRTALQSPDSAEILLNRLNNGVSIGLNFKQELADFLIKHHEPLKTQLQPLVNKALGVRIIPAEQLFKMIGSLNQLDNLPKHELLIIFSEYLQHLIDVGDDNTLQQSKNMLGWLHGDKLASCLFWLDRLPSNARSSPSEQHSTRILQSCLDLLTDQGVAENLEPALPQLSWVKLKKDQLHTLCKTVLNSQTLGVQISNNAPESLCLSFIQILAQHASILSDEIFRNPAQEPVGQAPIRNFYKDILKFCGRLKPQSIPPLFANMISIRNKLIHIHFPDTQLEVSLTPPSLTLMAGNMRKYITNYFLCVSSGLSSPKEELNMIWNDGCVFTGTVAPGTRNEQFLGTFASPIKHPLPQGLKGLIDLPRALCSTKWPDFCYDDHRIIAEGLFHGGNLLKANNIEKAIKCLSKGKIHDESTLDDSKLCYQIMNGFPFMCELEVEDDEKNITTTLQIVFDKQRQSPSLPEFNNAWNLPIPEHHLVYQDISSPSGEQITVNMTWNAKTRAFNGQGEIKGERNHLPYKWKGLVKHGNFLPKGSLFVGNNKTPALILDSKEEKNTLPMTLIVLLGTWFTGEMNGHYPFKSNIWNQRDVWPPKDFEGFITDYTMGAHHFSGYKTADGRALGIWTNQTDVRINANAEDPHYSLYIGSFLTQETTSRHYGQTPAPMGALQDNLGIPLSPDTALVPHGLMHQTVVNKNTYTAALSMNWMFFKGQGLSYVTMDQNPEIRYDVPKTTRHFSGKGYKDAGKTKMVDLVFNPEDGGTDFMMIRPENFLHEPNYQSIYHDTQGLTQKILRMNNQVWMGDLTFPSGIRYMGEIQQKEDTLHLKGRFKITVNQLKFQGILDENPDKPLLNLKAMSDQSTWALDSIKKGYGIDRLTLSGLITFISAGLLSYDADIKPHLKIRTFTATTGDCAVTQFSLPQ